MAMLVSVPTTEDTAAVTRPTEFKICVPKPLTSSADGLDLLFDNRLETGRLRCQFGPRENKGPVNEAEYGEHDDCQAKTARNRQNPA
jgi:hypothetical protein